MIRVRTRTLGTIVEKRCPNTETKKKDGEIVFEQQGTHQRRRPKRGTAKLRHGLATHLIIEIDE